MTLAHATCVEIDGTAVLLRGPSGAGKSDLALRLIDQGAKLVADDQVSLEPGEGGLGVTAPEALAGLLEVRGVGLCRLPHVTRAWVKLVVDLVDGTEVERMPAVETTAIAGVRLPLLRLAPFEASAPAKLRLVIRRLASHSGQAR